MPLPVVLKIEEKAILVIGGGRVALEKITKLLHYQAKIHVVALSVIEEILVFQQQGQITIEQRAFQLSDLSQDYTVIICATNDKQMSERLYHEAQKRKIWFNAVDIPAYCDFYFTSDFVTPEFTISVSSNGRCPMLATFIRDHFAKHLKDLQSVFKAVIKKRQALKSLNCTVSERTLQLKDFFQHQLKKRYQEMYQFNPGTVYLVGAGPGDLKLITQRCLEALKSADIIFYDALVNPAILAEVPEPCVLHYVGKRAGLSSVNQEQINQLLIESALQNKVVVRLKGGSPGVFSRTHDEIQALQHYNIPYQMISGISAACAVIESLNLPLTSRQAANKIIVLTGHFQNNEKHLMNYLPSCREDTSFVIYMGLGTLTRIVEQFLTAGFSMATPIALISDISMNNEKILMDNLGNILLNPATDDFHSPTLIIIGSILHAYQKLDRSNKELTHV